MKVLTLRIRVDSTLVIPNLMHVFYDDMLECDTALAVMADPTKSLIALSCTDYDFFNHLKKRVSDFEEVYGSVHFISDNIYDL